MTIQSYVVEPQPEGVCLVIHGGAGGRVQELSLEAQGQYAAGLERAHAAGFHILNHGGTATDAVCAAVCSLEDNPLFNAGRGAALTATGQAELDSCLMLGTGDAGAAAAITTAKNPILVARAVLEQSDHALVVAPPSARLNEWQIEQVPRSYYVTPARQQQLANVQARLLAPARHGTVGAVALDRQGLLAAATSTGGMVNQMDGRVGDTPIVGAGTFAQNGVAAISCTGEGEAFIKGVVAHDIIARMKYLGATADVAVTNTIETELGGRNATGGIIIATADGGLVVAHNSPAMFAAYRSHGAVITHT